MSTKIIDISNVKDRLSVEKTKEKIRSECENIIAFCTKEQEGITFFKFEKELWKQLSYLGCLYTLLFLMSCHKRPDYSKQLNTSLYYAGKAPMEKTIKTVFGEVKYFRTYLVRKDSPEIGRASCRERV